MSKTRKTAKSKKRSAAATQKTTSKHKGGTKQKRPSGQGSAPKQTGASKPMVTAKAAMSLAANTAKGIDERVKALNAAPIGVRESEENLQPLLTILGNQDEPMQVRVAALKALQTAAFSVATFEPYRGDYIATLRKVARDPNAELRRRALGILAREKDGFAQKQLLEGLENPEKALVSPEKALQLLSYDVHAEAYTAARKVVDEPPNTAAKREALRLLAADASAAPVFEKILRDKKELPEIRQLSAVALHAVQPEKLQKLAREIVLDKSEQDAVQATSLTAITQFGDAKAVAEDKALMKRITKLSDTSSTKVKKSARQFLSKFKR